MCGDSTDPEQVEQLMNGSTADLVVTDPPYNVNYEGKTSESLKIQNDKMNENEFEEFIKMAFLNMKNVLKDGGAFYIWHATSSEKKFFECIKYM